MAKRGSIGDYTHAKLMELIDENSGDGDVTNPVLDDVKLYFGTDSDSYIEYRETDDNFMVISGSKAPGGLVLSGSQLVLDTGMVASGTAAGPASLLSVTSTGQVVLTASAGGGVTNPLADDTPLYFGSDSDASIEYSSAPKRFILSGSVSGSFMSGSTLFVGGLGTGSAGADVAPYLLDTFRPSPVSAVDIITDFNDGVALPVTGTAVSKISQLVVLPLAGGFGGGDMIKWGTFHGSVNKMGQLIVLFETNGFPTWTTANAASGSSGGGVGNTRADRMLGTAQSVGSLGTPLVLLKGYQRVNSAFMNNFTSATVDIGKAVYVASGSAGKYSMAPPSGSGDIVRVVGHMLDSDGKDHLIYFNPDNTWIEIV